MRVIPDITGLKNHAAWELLLDVEVVLVHTWGAEMRINQAQTGGTAERLGAGKTRWRAGRRGREGVGRACIVGAERIGKISRGAGLGPARRVEVKAGMVVERRGSIELENVFALKDVVEHSEATTNRGLGVAEDIPGETSARRPIVLIGEVDALRRSRIAGEDYARGRVDKALTLVAGYEAERSSLGIVFRLGVFVAEADVESQPAAHVKVVLRVTCNLVCSHVTESAWALEVVVGQAKKKIGQIRARANARSRPIEIEAPISNQTKPCVVLIR